MTTSRQDISFMPVVQPTFRPAISASNKIWFCPNPHCRQAETLNPSANISPRSSADHLVSYSSNKERPDLIITNEMGCLSVFNKALGRWETRKKSGTLVSSDSFCPQITTEAISEAMHRLKQGVWLSSLWLNVTNTSCTSVLVNKNKVQQSKSA